MVAGIRFLWLATKGYRMRPWMSPYLRWRLETYSGKWANALTFKDFWALVWGERRQAMRFLNWVGEMRELAEKGTTQLGRINVVFSWNEKAGLHCSCKAAMLFF